jgi:hypothetical protein
VPFCGFTLICEAVDLPEDLAYLYFGFNRVVADAAKPCEVRFVTTFRREIITISTTKIVCTKRSAYNQLFGIFPQTAIRISLRSDRSSADTGV